MKKNKSNVFYTWDNQNQIQFNIFQKKNLYIQLIFCFFAHVKKNLYN